MNQINYLQTTTTVVPLKQVIIMQTIKSRIVNFYTNKQAGMFVYVVLILLTATLLALPQEAFSLLHKTKPINSDHNVQISGKLSQTKLVQGGQQTVYMQVTIKPPVQDRIIAPERATDMIIVLDRSGSMSEAKKMSYAKAAINDVLSRLNPADRFALVSFSNHAIIHSPLTSINSAKRESLQSTVNSIISSGGTNIGHGLNTALSMIRSNDSNRVKKVLLLSDGQANQGITDPIQLSAIATRLNQSGAVLSSIGMGLNFNETLMAKLADYGMGHYAYLEDLTGLGQILTRDLKETRNRVASGSSVEIILNDGILLIDAGGYPITRNGRSINISTGQLLSNTDKHFIMTLSLPTHQTGKLSLGQIKLVYKSGDKRIEKTINTDDLILAVVEPKHKQEALNSIDKDVYKQSWIKNNLGKMQEKLSHWVRSGNKDQAMKEIASYRLAVKKAEDESNLPMASIEMDDKLDAMETEISTAFVGSPQKQEIKRKRAAKSIQFKAREEQRSGQ